MRSKLLIKKLAFKLSVYIFKYRPFSPSVHFTPTHMMNNLSPSLFFVTLLLLCIIDAKEYKKTGEAWKLTYTTTYIDLLLKRNGSSPSSLC